MSAPLTKTAGATRVAFDRGALLVEFGDDALLVDVPSGIEASAAIAPALGRLRAIATTSGRISSVGGLVPLLCALERLRAPDAALTLHVALGEERAATLAEVWTRCWPDRYPLTLDAQRAGSSFEAGPIEVRTAPIRTGDVRWATGATEPGVGMALRLATPDLTVAVVLGAAPDRTLRRLCEGVDLAVVEVGVLDRPKTDRPWRLRFDEALELTSSASAAWLVGDDGAPYTDAIA